MRLYYLTELKWAEKILREGRFKLSTIAELNDPFELLGAAVGEKTARRAYQTLHSHWRQTIGILCTSRSWESPVMWAHYGNKHQGVCLGFDLDGANAYEVTYKEDRITGLLDHIGHGKKLLEEQMHAVLTTKFKDWSYEREWRLFARLDQRAAEDGKYYLNFEPHIKLREVILGARCGASVQTVAGAVQPMDARVEVFKARAAFDSFRIVRQNNVASVFIEPSNEA